MGTQLDFLLRNKKNIKLIACLLLSLEKKLPSVLNRRENTLKGQIGGEGRERRDSLKSLL